MVFSWKGFLDLNLNENIQVITPNQRLTKFLNKQYQNKVKNSEIAFHADKVLSIEQYLSQQFFLLQLRHPSQYARFQILTLTQEYHLWKEIVEQSPFSESLLFKTLGLNKIISANQTCLLWNIDLKTQQKLHHQSLDQNIFESWQDTFNKLCAEKSFLTSPQLYSIISNSIEKKLIEPAKQYYFYGFDEISPAQACFIDFLGEKVRVEKIPLPTEKCQTQQSIALSNLEDEITSAAFWAKSIIDGSPDKSLAIVIPSLNENRRLIDSTFTRILNPEKLSLFQQTERTFNLSSGIALSDMPLVKSALRLLEFVACLSHEEKLNIHHFLNIINDPFLLPNEITLDQRIKLSERISKECFSKMKAKELWLHLKKLNNRNSDLTALFTSIEELENLSKTGTLKKKESYSYWKNTFKLFLENFNWLQNEKLNSENYQCCQKFNQALLELCRLDECSSKKVAISEAISSLKTICQQTIFQPESTNEDENRINVLGVLEAAAHDFDYIWICQMNDHIWPSPAKPNPYLANSLQKSLDMPHASAEKELRFSKQMIERFSHHCTHLIFSFSTNDGDAHIKASSLIKDIPGISKTELLSTIQLIEEHIKSGSKIDYFNDDKPLPLGETQASGGQGLIKSQANCPFQAFAAYRLGLKEMEKPVDGISAIDRGNILHRLMELFWNRVGDQKTLLTYSHEQLDSLIEELCNESSKEYVTLRQHAPKAFKLELQRAKRIVTAFVEAEKDRAPFKVLACEEKKHIKINDLELNLRVDRKDELEDGSLMVIDYKSGKASTNDWIPPRMEEPQLPLYLYQNKDTQAISFAILNLNPLEAGFQGLASKAGIAKGIDDCNDENKKINRYFKGDWNTFVTNWEQDIEHQVNDFKQGNTKLDPKKTSSCTYCSFSNMCRIQELKI